MSVTNSSGDVSGVSTIYTPEAAVTRVTLSVDVPTPATPCLGGWPISVSFDGTIETNGPATVTYRWETSQGDVSGDITLVFTAFGAQAVTENYHIGAAADYWVRLHVLTPNDVKQRADYTVTCTP
jgi:hypothetical protein